MSGKETFAGFPRITTDEEAMNHLAPLLDYLASGPMTPEWDDEDQDFILDTVVHGETHRSGERMRAVLARRMAKEMLKAARSNGLGGCQLCVS